MVEHDHKDNRHDRAHGFLLPLLIGHVSRIFRRCRGKPLLEKHDNAQQNGEQVKLVSNKENGGFPLEKDVWSGQIVNPSRDENRSS